MPDMKGKVFAVTGAGSGIGRATAVRLAELGAQGVAISDVNEAMLEETRQQCSRYATKVTVKKVDVANTDEVDQWIRDVVGDHGRLDGAANVAGIAGGEGQITEEIVSPDQQRPPPPPPPPSCPVFIQTSPVPSCPDSSKVQKDWERMISVNLTGVMNCMRAQLREISRPGGSIVNVSSTSGLRGLPRNAAYASSKFGVVGLTESTAAEYGKLGVRVNALLPGPIDTKIFRDGEKKGLFDSDLLSAGTLLGRMGQADEVAKVLVFLLSDDASYVTGARTSKRTNKDCESARWTVDGGYSACGFYRSG
ncbi:hypothetical protein AYO21_09413 [Fonsecaea monophora]|uniref:Uncharacterized protein n=1 Tax=Fonsecaea monophora TaxID=254056 RepID=A0A177EWU4_9EURO|nr:hypothetical protein AYO21_09413 [Fonsecaea monophora]OAG36428.1 hypothetical protein AYO21_09413 [Fonsecaea monophora]